MADLTNILNGPWEVPRPEEIAPEFQMMYAIDASGLEPPDNVIIDGAIHRFNPDGKPRNKSGWYIAYPDGVVAGAFGDWKSGVHQRWCADIGRELTLNEKVQRDKRYDEAREAREAERSRLAEVVAETVGSIWESCAPASEEHPYLKKKGVLPHGARVSGDGRLVLPLYDEKDNLVTLQYIDPQGGKMYHKGGPTSGKYWTIGDPGKTIYLAEGFATGASIHEVTRQGVVIAYSANNLFNVAGLIREKYGPEHNVVIVADNDESGTGIREAEKAGNRWGMRIVMPPELGDANDYVQEGHDLLALLNPKSDGWLIQADEFCENPSPIRWLVKNWVQGQALQMVHGPSGCGKTFLVLDWCLRIAAGLPEWNGHRVREGSVVYLAGEGHYGLRGRVKAWKIHHGIDELSMWLSRDGCDLNKHPGYQLVADHIRALPVNPDVIVVDTLHRFLLGDENSAQDAREMLDACAKLMKEFSCTVILVHHTGVSEEAQHRARGSSAWRGALDIEVSVISAGPDDPIEVVQRKSKDSEITPPVWVELQKVDLPGWVDEDGEQVSSAVIVECNTPGRCKVDTKLAAHKKMFERAWFASGMNIMDGKPYIARDKMLEFLVQNDGNSEATAKNMIKPSHTNRFIGYLINGEIIENTTDGWVVKDTDFTSALLIMR